MQKPGATGVAGFYAWNQLERRVERGEKGIMILAHGDGGPAFFIATAKREGNREKFDSSCITKRLLSHVLCGRPELSQGITR